MKLKVENGKLQFDIENSREQIETNKKKSSIGLCNVRRQLELTYQDFKLDVKDEERTFKVHLAIDLFDRVEF
jgi:two-component system, LytTR family, sensor kinase